MAPVTLLLAMKGAISQLPAVNGDEDKPASRNTASTPPSMRRGPRRLASSRRGRGLERPGGQPSTKSMVSACWNSSRPDEAPGGSASFWEGELVMIRANTRGRLSAADLQLVILLLSRGSAHRRAYLERRLASEGPDSLLDAPDLLERLLTVRSMLVPSEALFFYVLVRQALRSAQLDDRELADYLAAM